jgi:hypothetical protein
MSRWRLRRSNPGDLYKADWRLDPDRVVGEQPNEQPLPRRDGFRILEDVLGMGGQGAYARLPARMRASSITSAVPTTSCRLSDRSAVRARQRAFLSAHCLPGSAPSQRRSIRSSSSGIHCGDVERHGIPHLVATSLSYTR